MSVTYDLQESIATITLDDGKMNALSPDMFSAIGDALTKAEAARAVVILTGRQGVFSGGFDLKVLMGGGPEAYKMVRAGFLLGERLFSSSSPVVIACSGHAIAMGVFLMLSADYRLGVSGAYRIGANEVSLGITMPFFGVEICRQRLAPAHFHRAVINAEIYDPESAVLAGFLDRLVATSELQQAAREVAAGLAKLDRDAYAATKLRARAPSLQAIRAAIEADDAFFRGQVQ